MQNKILALTVQCPACRAIVGEGCISKSEMKFGYHVLRLAKARKENVK